MFDHNSLSREWLNKLQVSGYRLTGPRRAIAEIVASSTRALGPMDIFEQGRKEYPGLGLVTVYRTLEKMDQLGLIQRVHLPSGCHMYLRAACGHEHLLLCTGCGRAEYFQGDDLSALMQKVTLRSGFEIQDHWLQFFGLCPNCQASRSGDSHE